VRVLVEDLWPREDQHVAGKVKNQIREQKKPGDPDEELDADGRGKIAPESQYRRGF
jgi:hypothetical protein